MQLAVEQASFSEMTVTSVVSSEASYQALCGNGECETHEATQGHELACAEDCSSTQECPRADANTMVGEPHIECAGQGVCIHQSDSTECSCNIGHQGELAMQETLQEHEPSTSLPLKSSLLAGSTCTECEYGFVPRGSPATCTPTRSRFVQLTGADTGLGAQLQRTLLIVGVVAAVLLVSALTITLWCCCMRSGGTQDNSTTINDSLAGSSTLSWAHRIM